MKAPDKIYLHGYPLYDEPCAEWAEVPFYSQFRGQQAETVEYICKDALISFLEKEKYDLYNWHFQDEDRKFKVYEEVINKIKEL